MGKGVSCIRRRLVVNEDGAVQGRTERRLPHVHAESTLSPRGKGRSAYDTITTCNAPSQRRAGRGPARSVGNSTRGPTREGKGRVDSQIPCCKKRTRSVIFKAPSSKGFILLPVALPLRNDESNEDSQKRASQVDRSPRKLCGLQGPTREKPDFVGPVQHQIVRSTFLPAQYADCS